VETRHRIDAARSFCFLTIALGHVSLLCACPAEQPNTEPVTEASSTGDPDPSTSTSGASDFSGTTWTEATSTGSSKTVSTSAYETTSGVAIHCDIGGPNPCPSNEACVPFDARDEGYWSGTRCQPSAEPKAPGEACSVPDGSLDEQGDCGHGRVCLVTQKSSSVGVCARTDVTDLECETECLGAGFFVCLEEIGCPEAGPHCDLIQCP